MSDVRITNKYIHRALTPAAKITTTALFFKNDDDVVMTTYDHTGSCKVSITTGNDNFLFGNDELGILDLSDLNKYIKLTEYGKDEDAYMKRIESKTVRGYTMDCLELGGKIGKFTVPTAHLDNFEDMPNRQILDTIDNITDSSVTKILKFTLSKEELSDLFTIGTSLMVEKVTLVPTKEGIRLYLKGRGTNQYTKIISPDNVTYYDYVKNNNTVDYFSDDDSLELLPFSFQILMHANSFNDNFTFDIVKKRHVYALRSFGGFENSLQDTNNDGTSNIKYSLVTTLNPNNEVGGSYVDVFDIN